MESFYYELLKEMSWCKKLEEKRENTYKFKDKYLKENVEITFVEEIDSIEINFKTKKLSTRSLLRKKQIFEELECEILNRIHTYPRYRLVQLTHDFKIKQNKNDYMHPFQTTKEFRKTVLMDIKKGFLLKNNLNLWLLLIPGYLLWSKRKDLKKYGWLEKLILSLLSVYPPLIFSLLLLLVIRIYVSTAKDSLFIKYYLKPEEKKNGNVL